jgi:sulfatase maturation enzyme AslB (radical SAM superfamily)
MADNEGPKRSTFCPLPWTLLTVQPSGIIRVCSPGHSSPGRAILRAESGRPHRLGESRISDARNSDLLKKIRRNMLSGQETPEVCIRCITEESTGVQSRRLIEREKAEFLEADARKITAEDGSLRAEDMPLRTIDLRLGNLCNLRCRMCWPGASSAWYEEYFSTRYRRFRDGDEKYELVRTKEGRVTLKQDIFAWPKDEAVWLDLERHIAGAKEIHFSGGEPLLIDNHYELLEKIIEAGRAGETRLDYNTNLTLLPDRLFKLWASFERVSLGVSVDAFGAVNDYIRHPSKFDGIAANLDRLDATPANVVVWIATTVQALNIYYLPDLLRWLDRRQFRKISRHKNGDPYLSWHPLSGPPYLSAKILPPSLKYAVEARFREYLASYKEHLGSLGFAAGEADRCQQARSSYLQTYLDFMRSEDLSDLLPKFWEEMTVSDQHRRQDIRRILPEITTPILEFLRIKSESAKGART